MGERKGWAEALVLLGGALLVLSFFLPLLIRGSVGAHPISSAGLALDQISQVLGGGSKLSDRLLALVFLIYLSAPHVLGALLVVDSATSRLFPGRLERTVRVGLRGILYPWLAGSILLPVLVRGREAQSVRIFCIISAGLLLVGWVVIGRWWAPQTHAAHMRRGRLIGAILVGVWFAWLLSLNEGFEIQTIGISLSGATLIVAGSVTGLFDRGRPEIPPPPDPSEDE